MVISFIWLSLDAPLAFRGVPQEGTFPPPTQHTYSKGYAMLMTTSLLVLLLSPSCLLASLVHLPSALVQSCARFSNE